MILHRHDDPKLDRIISTFTDGESIERIEFELQSCRVRVIFNLGGCSEWRSILKQGKPGSPWFNLIEYIKEKYPEVFL